MAFQSLQSVVKPWWLHCSPLMLFNCCIWGWSSKSAQGQVQCPQYLSPFPYMVSYLQSCSWCPICIIMLYINACFKESSPQNFLHSDSANWLLPGRNSLAFPLFKFLHLSCVNMSHASLRTTRNLLFVSILFTATHIVSQNSFMTVSLQQQLHLQRELYRPVPDHHQSHSSTYVGPQVIAWKAGFFIMIKTQLTWMQAFRAM